MSYQDDIDDKDPVVFIRPATTIAFTVPEGERPIPPIELPEVRIRRSEASPAWLAAHDAEQAEQLINNQPAAEGRKETTMTDQQEKPEEPAPTKPPPWGSFPWDGSMPWPAPPKPARTEREEQSK